jgi:hypothetical protein
VQLAAWLDAAAPEAERQASSTHLDGCDDCLGEAFSAARLMRRLDRAPRLPVPAALTARVASRWPAPEPEPPLATLVVRITRAGAKLLEKVLVPPWIELAELPTPAGAVRSGDAAAAEVRFQLVAAETRILATILAAGDAVGLVLALEDLSGARLADQRVFLRHRGRPVFSARTDAEGLLRSPGLDRGVYEVSCPGIGTSFRLDLR